MLYDYAQRNKGKIEPIYYVSGTSIVSGMHTIQFASEKKLNKLLEHLHPVTSQHIYSISKTIPSTISDLYNLESHSEYNHRDYNAVKCGDPINIRTRGHVAKKEPINEAKSKAPISFIKKEKQTDKNICNLQNAAQKGHAALFGKKSSLKQEVKNLPEKQEEEEEKKPAIMKESPKKHEEKKSKKLVPVKKEKKMKKRKDRDESADQEDSLVMDEEDEVIEEVAHKSGNKTQHKTAPKKQITIESESDDDSMKDDSQEKVRATPPKKTAAANKKTPSPQKNILDKVATLANVKQEPKKKTKRVKKQTYYTDENGFKVSREEWVEEEVDEESPSADKKLIKKKEATQGKKKADSPNKSANKGSNPQGSIMSFFTKK